MRQLPYDRSQAVAYARHWALGRNPRYFDFETLGGDCTNFASQCLYAGAGVMNFTPNTGWFYLSVGDRTPSWTAVEPLYRFLVTNRTVGPYARVVPRGAVQPGDLVQLGDGSGRFYHCPVITAVSPRLLVAAHTFDALARPLDSYGYEAVRFLHIEGVRAW